jgi:hypothetical protein
VSAFPHPVNIHQLKLSRPHEYTAPIQSLNPLEKTVILPSSGIKIFLKTKMATGLQIEVLAELQLKYCIPLKLN